MTIWTVGDAISGTGTLVPPGRVNRVDLTSIPAWQSNRGGVPARYYFLGVAGYYNDTSYYPAERLEWPDQELAPPPADATGIYYRLEAQVTGLLYRGVEMANELALACRVRRTTDQTITNATLTKIAFNAAVSNAFGMWSAGTNPDRVTILEPGWYQISACVAWQANTTGMRATLLRVNDTYYISAMRSTNAGNSERTAQVVSSACFLNKADWVEVWVAHAAGGDLAVFAENEWTPVLSVARVG